MKYTSFKPVHFFVLVKPDGVKNLGDIIQMYLEAFAHDSNSNIKVLVKHMERISPYPETREKILQHYAKSDKWKIKYGRNILALRNKLDINAISDATALTEGNNIVLAIAKYMTSGYMYAIVFVAYVNNTEDQDKVFEIAREVLGDIEPEKAEIWSIRGKYSKDSFEKAWSEKDCPRAIENICHCSESEDEAKTEADNFLGKDLADAIWYSDIVTIDDPEFYMPW
jgi:nucleoside diphosphate kinase